MLFCPDCKKSSLILCEITTRKCSLALLYELKGVWGWKHEFYNSRKYQRAYEVNRKFVHSMREIKNGHSGALIFCTFMNMPKPLTPKNYRKHATVLRNHAKLMAN